MRVTFGTGNRVHTSEGLVIAVGKTRELALRLRRIERPSSAVLPRYNHDELFVSSAVCRATACPVGLLVGCMSRWRCHALAAKPTAAITERVAGRVHRDTSSRQRLHVLRLRVLPTKSCRRDSVGEPLMLRAKGRNT